MAQNCYQAATTPGKLHGQYYTPPELVALILDALCPAPPDLVLDPACGDGSFLTGVVAAVARRSCGRDRQALAQHWAGRLIGFDVDQSAVAAARSRLQEAFQAHLGADVAPEALHIYPADALRYPELGTLLREVGAPAVGRGERLLIVGNPPYVEAKRLSREAKETLTARYPGAVAGAPDLYLYFLHVCVGWLRPADTLAFVLPNKLLVNANAQKIRERLLDEGRLRSLWFATQARIFPDAAVYPIVLFGSGAASLQGQGGIGGHPGVEIAHIVRTAAQEISQGEPVTIAPQRYRQTSARAFFPLPETPVLRDALERLLRQLDAGRLADVLNIRWSISFHRAGLRERYVLPHRPPDACARTFIGGGPFSGNGEVTRYRLEWAGWWIRYDQDALQAEQNPLPDPSLFERPKIVICQNGRTVRAAYDDQGFVLKDTFLCGSIRESEHPLCRFPRAIVGLLCSRAIHFFYSHVFYGGHVNGGYLHFLRSFLVDIPLGAWTDEAAEELAALVRQREAATSARQQEQIEEQIETRVSEALGLTPAERDAIAEWVAQDANWEARERVRRVEKLA